VCALFFLTGLYIRAYIDVRLQLSLISCCRQTKLNCNSSLQCTVLWKTVRSSLTEEASVKGVIYWHYTCCSMCSITSIAMRWLKHHSNRHLFILSIIIAT